MLKLKTHVGDNKINSIQQKELHSVGMKLGTSTNLKMSALKPHAGNNKK